MCVCVYIYIYICMYVCMYMDTHTHINIIQALTQEAAVLLRWLLDLKGVDICHEPSHESTAEGWRRRQPEPSFQLSLNHGGDPEFERLEREYGAVEGFHGVCVCVCVCTCVCVCGYV